VLSLFDVQLDIAH